MQYLSPVGSVIVRNDYENMTFVLIYSFTHHEELQDQNRFPDFGDISGIPYDPDDEDWDVYIPRPARAQPAPGHAAPPTMNLPPPPAGAQRDAMDVPGFRRSVCPSFWW